MADDWTLAALKEHFEEMRRDDKEALKTALDAANEKAKTHNDILGAMKDQQATFVTKEQVRWTITALIAGIALALGIFSAIGGMG